MTTAHKLNSDTPQTPKVQVGNDLLSEALKLTNQIRRIADSTNPQKPCGAVADVIPKKAAELEGKIASALITYQVAYNSFNAMPAKDAIQEKEDRHGSDRPAQLIDSCYCAFPIPFDAKWDDLMEDASLFVSNVAECLKGWAHELETAPSSIDTGLAQQRLFSLMFLAEMASNILSEAHVRAAPAMRTQLSPADLDKIHVWATPDRRGR